LAALVPPAVVTNTLAGPAVPECVVQVAEVAETTLKLVQEKSPTLMSVASVKSVPVIVMGVPPAVEPDVGETAVTVGAGVAVGVGVGVGVGGVDSATTLGSSVKTDGFVKVEPVHVPRSQTFELFVLPTTPQ